MVSRLEIRLKKELMDAEGAGIRRKLRQYFGFEVEDVRVIRVLTIDADLTPGQLEQIRTGLFTNPVTEDSSYDPIADDFDWIIWVGLRPGVRDTAGSTAVEAIEDLLGIKFKAEQNVYTSKIYQLREKSPNTRPVKSRVISLPMISFNNGRSFQMIGGTLPGESGLSSPRLSLIMNQVFQLFP